MTERQYLDANILVRLLTGDQPSQARAAASYINRPKSNRPNLILTPATLSEVVFVLLGQLYRRSRAEVSDALGAIIDLPIEIDDRRIVETAVSLYRDHHPGWGDCLLAAYSLERAGGNLLSYDRALSRIPGIVRVEPPLVPTP